MLVLGIETATATASVGVVDGEPVLAERTVRMTRSHAASLLPLIDETLRQAGVAPGDLGAVAVSIGPGSFTGLRIGLSVAKGLALTCGLAIVGVPTLEALAEAAHTDGAIVCPVLDARRGEVYVAAYRCGAEHLECLREAMVANLSDLARYLPSACQVVGDVIDSHGPLLRRSLGPGVDLLGDVMPSGAIIAGMGARRIGLVGADDPVGLEPTYVQVPDAERNRAARC